MSTEFSLKFKIVRINSSRKVFKSAFSILVSFVNLYDRNFLSASYVNDTSPVAIPPNQEFYYEYDILQLVYIIQRFTWLMQSSKFTSPADPSTLIHLANVDWTLGAYVDYFEQV